MPKQGRGARFSAICEKPEGGGVQTLPGPARVKVQWRLSAKYARYQYHTFTSIFNKFNNIGIFLKQQQGTPIKEMRIKLQ